MAALRPIRRLDPIAPDQQVGRWLAALEDGRGRTLDEVRHLRPDQVDAAPNGPLATIGSLLYHIGLIEADWVAGDILGLGEPPELLALLPWPDRDEHGRLTIVSVPLDEHLARLATIRGWVLERLRPLSSDDLSRLRAMPDYDVAPDWAIHHLIQHEAEHRAHIAWIRDTT